MYWASVARNCGHWVPKVRDGFWVISWVSCFYDTSCCFYDTSMILLVKEREMYHFDNTLSISCITYYFKSKMRLWYIFREKISFVCKLLPIYEPCLSVIYSSYPYDFFYSVTCQLHAPSTVLKGFCSVLGLFRIAQLHASYMSYAQVTTSNSRERPQIAK